MLRHLWAEAAVRSPLRFMAAAGCLTAAAAHLPVTEDHLQEATYIGALFIVLSVACVLEAGALLRRDTRGVWGAVAGTCAAAVAAYLWSRAVGLPEIADDVGHWTEPLGVVSVAAEAVAVGCAVVALARPNPGPSLRRGGPAVAGSSSWSRGWAAPRPPRPHRVSAPAWR